MLDHTNCLISHVRLLYFILVPVTTPGNPAKAVAVAIVVSIVVVVIMINAGVVLYCRCVIKNLVEGYQDSKLNKSLLKSK